MLRQIDLQRFKCFEKLQLPLCPMTLLSGVNASGKSSVMQALALLHQTMREHEWSQRLVLNGTAVHLGAAADVIDQIHGHDDCGITLLDGDEARFQWEFKGEHAALSMAVSRAHGVSAAGKGWDVDGSGSFHYLLPTSLGSQPLTARLCNLTYLTAERLGPKEYYPLGDPQLRPVVGSRGEYAVSVLYFGSDEDVPEKMVIKTSPPTPPTRFQQVEARMASFFPGCVLDIEKIPRTNAVTLGVRTSSDMDFHRPVHAGFGLTQVLPIVIAILSARKDDLLLIENPEVHLHPAGQAAIGRFLAEAAAAGVQVIIETHSDHVLNGIRRAVKRGVLPGEDVALHFFRPRRGDQKESKSQVQSPNLDNNGNIDDWPDGFFDQFDKDMNYFAGWS